MTKNTIMARNIIVTSRIDVVAIMDDVVLVLQLIMCENLKMTPSPLSVPGKESTQLHTTTRVRQSLSLNRSTVPRTRSRRVSQ
jgi:hypothetical protein